MSVRCIACQLPIVIGCAVMPPDWSSFAQRDFGLIHRLARDGNSLRIPRCSAYVTSRGHELGDPVFSRWRIERWIR